MVVLGLNNLALVLFNFGGRALQMPAVVGKLDHPPEPDLHFGQVRSHSTRANKLMRPGAVAARK